MTIVDFMPLAAIVVLATATVVQRFASRAVQPARLALAEKGERFLARTDVPAGMRLEVSRILESPFSCNCVFLVLFIPFLPLIIWGEILAGRNQDHFREFSGAGHDVRGRYLEIRALSRKISLANHPILSPVGDLVVSLSLVMAVPYLIVSRRFNEGALDRDGAASVVDHYWSHLPKLSKAA